MSRIFFAVLFAVLLHAPARAWQVRTGDTIYPTAAVSWNFSDEAVLQLQKVQDGKEELPLQKLQLVVTDGKTQRELALSAPRIVATASTLSATQTAGDLSITQKLQASSPNNSLLWTVEIANDGMEEAWIETGLRGAVVEPSALQFWDGYELQKVGRQRIERSTPLMAFPATMLQNSTHQSALVVALHPDNDISWITTSLDPQKQEYFYGGRFAIPAREKIRVTYVLYALRPRFGELDAIDGYYQRFPAAVNATPDTNPRLTQFRGVNGSYVPRNVLAGNREPEPRLIEGLGKVRASWDWGYNTYKFSGDWFGRAENWELPLTQGDRAALEEYNQKRSSFDLHDLAQFHRDRIALYKNADLRANVEMSFYLLNFVQAELAQKNDWMKYTYGYFRADDPASGRIKRWVASYDDTWHMFPWATPLEETFRRDLPEILNELETTSFAIDVYADAAPYRGPTTDYLPGWSYDEKGRFINTGLANKRLVQFIHTLRKGDFTAGVVVNLSPWEKDPALKTDTRHLTIPNYSTIFAPDAYIVEGDVSELVDYDQPGRLFPKRYLFGKKYISSVGGAYHDKIGERIPWQTMSPNQIRAAYSNYLKKRLMAYYQGGILPNYDDARGISLFVNEMPRLLEIQARGFTAAPASAGDAKLQRRRYGDSLGAAVVYSNPTPQTLQNHEKLSNAYFANASRSVVLPFLDGNAKLDFTADKTASTTDFSLQVQSLENQILLLPLALQPDVPQALQGSTRVTRDAHQQTYMAELNVEQPVSGVLHIAPPRDFQLQSVVLNGKELPAQNGRLAIALKSGQNELQVRLASTQFLAPPQQLFDFDWKNFQIVIAGAPGDRKSSAAQLLTDYATYYEKFTPTTSTRQRFDAASTTPTVVIETGARRGIGFDAANPRVLRIIGRDDFDAQQLAWRLARLLDARYPQMPAATFTDPSTKAMLDRIGVMVNAEKLSLAKPITAELLQPVPGEDQAPSGEAKGNVNQLDFERVLPLPREDWTATASSSYVDKGNPISPAKALDGVAGTRWTPGRGKAGQWLQVDMQKPREFNHVRLQSPYPYKYFPLEYKAELSDDGEKWRAPVTGTGAKNTEIYWPQLQKARYIRVELTRDQPEFWSVDELLVYKRTLPPTEKGGGSPAPALETLPQLAVPRLSAAVQLDGKLDEAAWQKATLFELATPLKDHPITQPTQVRVFHDATAIYLGIVCREANMDKLWEPATERDGAVWSGDDVEIYLAPGDNAGQLKYPYYQFLLSPSGVQTDLKFDAAGKGDIKWNGDWQVKTVKAADQWSAEVRLPLAMMNGEETNVWRANVGRLETPNGDTTTWAPMQRVFAQPSLFGVWRMEP